MINKPRRCRGRRLRNTIARMDGTFADVTNPPIVPAIDELVAEANVNVSADYAAEHTRVVDEMIALRPIHLSSQQIAETDAAVKSGRCHISNGMLYENATIEQLMFAVGRYKQRMKAATHFALIGERAQALIRIEGATAEFKAFCNKFRLPIYFGE